MFNTRFIFALHLGDVQFACITLTGIIIIIIIISTGICSESRGHHTLRLMGVAQKEKSK
jgi:hypothetical protein